MPGNIKGSQSESDRSDSSKSFEPQPKEESEDPYDSEEDDIKFAERQQKLMDEEAKIQLQAQEDYEENPFHLNIGMLKLPEPKFR